MTQTQNLAKPRRKTRPRRMSEKVQIGSEVQNSVCTFSYSLFQMSSMHTFYNRKEGLVAICCLQVCQNPNKGWDVRSVHATACALAFQESLQYRRMQNLGIGPCADKEPPIRGPPLCTCECEVRRLHGQEGARRKEREVSFSGEAVHLGLSHFHDQLSESFKRFQDQS